MSEIKYICSNHKRQRRIKLWHRAELRNGRYVAWCQHVPIGDSYGQTERKTPPDGGQLCRKCFREGI